MKKTTKKTIAKANPNYARGIDILANVRYNLLMDGYNNPDLDLRGGYYLLAALYGKTAAGVTVEVEKKMNEGCKTKRNELTAKA